MDVGLLRRPRRIPVLPPKGFTRNEVRLIHAGREYFDVLKEMINRATESIHLQTYIFDDDDTGTEIGEALINAAKRNVKVFLLADGYASQSISAAFLHRLRDNGVNFRFFEPIFRSKYFYFGRRLHHKIVVADAKCALVGGINISNRYNDWDGKPAWLDFALYVEGGIARELCVLCYKTWKGFPQKTGITPCQPARTHLDSKSSDESLVRMRRNDWVRRENQISASYIEMLTKAKNEITILCSYFLPGREIRNQLIRAANRGVKVTVIMAGRSDVKIAKQAERFIYNDLLENHIDIFEYQKTILHGKIMVCDQEWLTIGSYNVNNISAYASIELNLDVYDPVFAKKVNEALHGIAMNDCIAITKEWIKKKNTVLEKFLQWSSYELIRLIFYLFTFYFKQQV